MVSEDRFEAACDALAKQREEAGVRALIFGGTGMLGGALARHARARDCAALALSRQTGDVTDAERIAYWMDAFRPTAIFNCAAFTQVDLCEERLEEANAVNGRAVGLLAEAAAVADVPFVHVSTDYVFDGKGSAPYPEDAALAPASVYGKSKLEGERRALAYEGAAVVRTSWLFGPGGPNFAATIAGKIDEGTPRLTVVDDQVGCPTYTPFLARALWEVAERGLRGPIHYRNDGPVSWYQFACEIARLRGGSTRVDPVSTSDYPRPAPRPAYSVLDVSRFEAAVGRRVESWSWGLAEYLERLPRAGASNGGLR